MATRNRTARTSSKSSRSRNSKQPRARVRYAVVGQGYISQIAVLPAFAHARRNSELTALVSDDPRKLATLGRRYRVDRLYSYEQFDECLASGEVDAVFIALPNHLHHAYTLRSARAGKHVLCEKPMAVTEDECLEMIEEAERNRVRLMVAYRLHFERANLKAVQIARAGRLGDLRTFNSPERLAHWLLDVALEETTLSSGVEAARGATGATLTKRLRDLARAPRAWTLLLPRQTAT